MDSQQLEGRNPDRIGGHPAAGGERGWGVATRREFDQEVADGSLYVGSPETVARKIAATVRVLSVGRFDMKCSAGTLPHSLMMRSIELYGTEVMPRVRDYLK